MCPFVTISNVHLSMLAGQAMAAVTRKGKIYEDNAKGISDLSDCILDIGIGDVNEVGIPDESKEDSKNEDEELQPKVYSFDVEGGRVMIKKTKEVKKKS